MRRVVRCRLWWQEGGMRMTGLGMWTGSGGNDDALTSGDDAGMVKEGAERERRHAYR